MAPRSSGTFATARRRRAREHRRRPIASTQAAKPWSSRDTVTAPIEPVNRGREQQLSRSEPPSGSSPNPSNIRSFEPTADIEANGVGKWTEVAVRATSNNGDRVRSSRAPLARLGHNKNFWTMIKCSCGHKNQPKVLDACHIRSRNTNRNGGTRGKRTRPCYGWWQHNNQPKSGNNYLAERRMIFRRSNLRITSATPFGVAWPRGQTHTEPPKCGRGELRVQFKGRTLSNNK